MYSLGYRKVRDLGLRTFALSCLLFLGTSAAFARDPGPEIDEANDFEVLSSGTVCRFVDNKPFPVPGRVITRGGKRFFESFQRVRSREIKRLLEGGKIGPTNGYRFKLRVKKLTDVIKSGRTECALSADIRKAVAASLASASAPDTSLDTLVSKLGTLFSAAGDPIESFIRVETNIVRAFKTKQDFDNLALLNKSLGEFYQVESPTASASASQIVVNANCPSQFEALLYHVNGVNEVPFVSLASSVVLRELASRANKTETDKIGFRHFYNTGGLPTTAGADICRLFVGPAGQATPSAGTNSGVAQLPTAQQVLAQAYQDALGRCLSAYGVTTTQTLAQFIAAAQSYAPDSAEVTSLTNLIAQDVQSGRKVVVVAHSQGNILGEQAIASLGSDSTSPYRTSVGLIAIASPSAISGSGTFGAFTSYTLANDVILGVAGALPANLQNVLSSNASITPSTHRFAVHDQVTSYLLETDDRASILNSIFSQKTALPNARQLIGQGFFQVTLTWDIPGDIDLHVFEPNGTHVFYASKIGRSGELDVDDIPGDGPENYFVCTRSRMESGTYKVEVNNYGGTTGTVANIAIRGGTQSKTYTVVMGAANAGASNQAVANVVYNGSRFTLP